ncbi:hypothetical protein CB1_009618001 [Camelus ferus]|nr:hypothetical protein CB1_009618001 [Camelus ferus]
MPHQAPRSDAAFLPGRLVATSPLSAPDLPQLCATVCSVLLHAPPQVGAPQGGSGKTVEQPCPCSVLKFELSLLFPEALSWHPCLCSSQCLSASRSCPTKHHGQMQHSCQEGWRPGQMQHSCQEGWWPPVLSRHRTFLSFVPLCAPCCSMLHLRIYTSLLIILLKSSHVLMGLRKLSFLHALTHIPVNKGTLGLHQARLVVQASPGLSNGCDVAQHEHSSMCFGQVSTSYHGESLVINANFEASGEPVHKLDDTLGLDGGNGRIDIFGNHVATVQQATSHLFTMARVTFHNLDGWLKINIQGSINSHGSSDGGYTLTYQPMQVSVGWVLDIGVSKADVIDSLIVYYEGTIRVLQGDKVSDLIANGVVTMGIIISSIFSAHDELLRVEELVAGPNANFINDCGFQIC